MDEAWKPMLYDDLDFTDRYEVSNTGRIRNIHTKHELSQYVTPGGYCVVSISLGSRKTYKLIRVHRAVARNFVPGYGIGLTVNHKDFNRQNNLFSNLEWITNADNIKHAIFNSSNWYIHPRKVICINTGEVFETIGDAQRWCNLKAKNGIIRCAQGKQLHAGKHPVTDEPLSWRYG